MFQEIEEMGRTAEFHPAYHPAEILEEVVGAARERRGRDKRMWVVTIVGQEGMFSLRRGVKVRRCRL